MGNTLSNQPKLSVRNLIFQRGTQHILDVHSLDVAAGRVLAIVGPNGAGKTTLVTVLGLLERPTRGEILFDGHSVSGRELNLRRRMAVVFQEPLLLDQTVRANVELGLKLRGIGERDQRARSWLDRFGIGHLAERSTRTLSGGEAQRVSLARAFALEPEVLFLDEPFSALDTPSRVAISNDLFAVLSQTRTTTVLVTHDHDEAARLGDQIAVMIGGTVRQFGTPAEVFGAPADEGVAAFVGVETIVAATVVGRDAGLVELRAGGQTIEALDTRSFDQALVCLRPEDISIAAVNEGRSAQSTRNALQGTIRAIAMSGGDARIDVDCGFVLRARITRRSVEEMRLVVGANVVATFKATAVHLIPK